jgi:hypothetical protein
MTKPEGPPCGGPLVLAPETPAKEAERSVKILKVQKAALA